MRSRTKLANPLVALIGPKLPPSLIINEWTTVAAVYCAAQFLNPSNLTILGPSHGVRAAAMHREHGNFRAMPLPQCAQKTRNAQATWERQASEIRRPHAGCGRLTSIVHGQAEMSKSVELV